jgi:iron complex outermembrane receptor protein
LSDLCRSGDVEKGFKIANPNLKPETLNNIEIGNTFDFKQKLTINTALYYSIGNQFQYFVSNGDSMYTTGTTMKPVIKRENINKVEIYGLELSVHLKATKTINLNLAYTYNHSTIKDFGLMETYNKDLNGKFLIDVPNNMLYAGITWHNKIANLSVDYKFKDKQWIDDQNTYQLPTRNYINLKVFKRFNDHIQCSFTVLNLLNKVFIDAKGLLSPGRYYNLELTVGL